MDWGQLLTISILTFILYCFYDSLRYKIRCFEKRIEAIENQNDTNRKNVYQEIHAMRNTVDRIDSSQDILHEHREFFEIEIAKIYNKLQKESGAVCNEL